MEPNQTATEPTPTQTTEPTPTEPAATVISEPAVEPQQTAEPQQQTTEPQSPTEPAPAEPTEPTEPDVRVVPKPSEYVLPEGVPDQIRIFAHEQGFTQGQLETTLNQFGGYLQGMHTQEQEALRNMGEVHLRNWGPDAKTKLSLAKQALKQNDPEGKLAAALESTGYGNHPAVLDFLHNIGKSMQEGGFLKSTVPRPPGEKTAAQAMYGDSITKKG